MVTPKQEVEQKSECGFCDVNFFRPNFKVVRKRCLNKNSLSRWWFFVHMRQFHFDFYCFFFIFFWIGCFLNGFPNLFIVHSRPSFFLLEPNFSFLLVVFCSHAAF